MRISITTFILIAVIYLRGAQSKNVKTYNGNAISDAKGLRKPFFNPLGNSISESYKRSKREIKKDMQEFQEVLNKAKYECVNELKMDPKIMKKSLMQAENPTTKEKCLMLCILKKTNLIENNQLSLKTIEGIASMVSQENPLVISVAVATANNCNSMIRSNKPCEIAYQINRCLGNELKAHKLKLYY